MMSKRVERRLSCKMDRRNLRGLKNVEVWESLSKAGFTEIQVQGIQIMYSVCIITFSKEEFKDMLISQGLSIRDTMCTFTNVGEEVTNVTIKDLPIELPDPFVLQNLCRFGKPISESLWHGLIQGTKIKTGTRYCKLTNVGSVVPINTKFGEHEVRLFCDNGKTECMHCGLTNHPAYKCVQIPKSNGKACFSCGSKVHLKKDCPLLKGQEEMDNAPKVWKSTPVQNNNGQNHGKHPTDVFPKNSTHIPPKTKLVIGASNMHGLTATDPTIQVLAESGTTAGNIDHLLDKEKDLEAYGRATIHLGTNDLKQKNNDSDCVVLNLQSALTRIRDRCANIVHLNVCSIPPKKGSGQSTEKFNEAAKSVNNFLRKLCEQSADLNYIDLSDTLTTASGKVKKAMYSVSDQSGIHYSEMGRKEVMRCIERAFSLPVDLAATANRKRFLSPSTPSPDSRPQIKRFEKGSPFSGDSLRDILESEELAQEASSV